MYSWKGNKKDERKQGTELKCEADRTMAANEKIKKIKN
jgi:hypothetical protein